MQIFGPILNYFRDWDAVANFLTGHDSKTEVL